MHGTVDLAVGWPTTFIALYMEYDICPVHDWRFTFSSYI